MRDDYRFAIDDQPPRTVTELTSAEIAHLLGTGLYMIPGTEEDGVDVDSGMERLRIELVIRALGL